MKDNNYQNPTHSARLIGKAILTVFSQRQKNWNAFYEFCLAEPQKFLHRLKKFDKERAAHLLPHLMKYLLDRDFPLKIEGLAAWLHSLYKYL